MTKFFRLVDKMPGGGKMWVRSIFLGCFGTKKQEACIMRLYKKAAAVLLAAAMAVSMMTACGGGAGGGSGVVPDGTHYSNAAAVEGIDPNSIEHEKPLTKAADSRYVQFMKKYQTEDKLYQRTEITGYGTSAGKTATMIEAKNGNLVYTEITGQGQTNKSLVEIKDNTVYSYILFEEDGKKAVIKQKTTHSGKTSPEGGTSETPSTSNATSANVKVNGTVYYAEMSRDEHGSTTICFEPNSPVPTYIFDDDGEGDKTTTVYKEVCFGNDKGLCDGVLDGYDVYTLEGLNMTAGTATLTDEKGGKYNAQYTASGWTVTKDGQDVTPEFQWIINKIFS